MNLFWKKSDGAIREVAAHEATSPVVRYVDALIHERLDAGSFEFSLFDGDALPLVMETWQITEQVDFAHVRNRLKIMVGLDPIVHKVPVMGTGLISWNAVDYAVRIDFRDAEQFSQIDLHFTPIGKSATTELDPSNN